MINLFYLVYAVFTIALIINMLLLIPSSTREKANEYFAIIFPPQVIMTIINLMFIYPSTQ